MYNVPYHKDRDPGVLKEFIRRYPFAFIAGCDAESKPVATQVPVFLEIEDGRQYLRGHIMRNTDHHKAFLQNENVLVVFSGHHTYVSGTWYSNPYTPSTWNYMSVHAKGRIRMLDDDALIDVLRKTSLHFENGNQSATTIFDNLPPAFIQKVIHAIVAFEIEVHDMDHIFKLSQDRDFDSYQNIIRQLRLQGESGNVIAGEMERRIGEVFPVQPNW